MAEQGNGIDIKVALTGVTEEGVNNALDSMDSNANINNITINQNNTFNEERANAIAKDNRLSDLKSTFAQQESQIKEHNKRIKELHKVGDKLLKSQQLAYDPDSVHYVDGKLDRSRLKRARVEMPSIDPEEIDFAYLAPKTKKWVRGKDAYNRLIEKGQHPGEPYAQWVQEQIKTSKLDWRLDAAPKLDPKTGDIRTVKQNVNPINHRLVGADGKVPMYAMSFSNDVSGVLENLPDAMKMKYFGKVNVSTPGKEMELLNAYWTAAGDRGGITHAINPKDFMGSGSTNHDAYMNFFNKIGYDPAQFGIEIGEQGEINVSMAKFKKQLARIGLNASDGIASKVQLIEDANRELEAVNASSVDGVSDSLKALDRALNEAKPGDGVKIIDTGTMKMGFGPDVGFGVKEGDFVVNHIKAQLEKELRSGNKEVFTNIQEQGFYKGTLEELIADKNNDIEQVIHNITDGLTIVGDKYWGSLFGSHLGPNDQIASVIQGRVTDHVKGMFVRMPEEIMQQFGVDMFSFGGAYKKSPESIAEELNRKKGFADVNLLGTGKANEDIDAWGRISLQSVSSKWHGNEKLLNELMNETEQYFTELLEMKPEAIKNMLKSFSDVDATDSMKTLLNDNKIMADRILETGVIQDFDKPALINMINSSKEEMKNMGAFMSRGVSINYMMGDILLALKGLLEAGSLAEHDLIQIDDGALLLTNEIVQLAAQKGIDIQPEIKRGEAIIQVGDGLYEGDAALSRSPQTHDTSLQTTTGVRNKAYEKMIRDGYLTGMNMFPADSLITVSMDGADYDGDVARVILGMVKEYASKNPAFKLDAYMTNFVDTDGNKGQRFDFNFPHLIESDAEIKTLQDAMAYSLATLGRSKVGEAVNSIDAYNTAAATLKGMEQKILGDSGNEQEADIVIAEAMAHKLDFIKNSVEFYEKLTEKGTHISGVIIDAVKNGFDVSAFDSVALYDKGIAEFLKKVSEKGENIAEIEGMLSLIRGRSAKFSDELKAGQTKLAEDGTLLLARSFEDQKDLLSSTINSEFNQMYSDLNDGMFLIDVAVDAFGNLSTQKNKKTGEISYKIQDKLLSFKKNAGKFTHGRNEFKQEMYERLSMDVQTMDDAIEAKLGLNKDQKKFYDSRKKDRFKDLNQAIGQTDDWAGPHTNRMVDEAAKAEITAFLEHYNAQHKELIAAKDSFLGATIIDSRAEDGYREVSSKEWLNQAQKILKSADTSVDEVFNEIRKRKKYDLNTLMKSIPEEVQESMHNLLANFEGTPLQKTLMTTPATAEIKEKDLVKHLDTIDTSIFENINENIKELRIDYYALIQDYINSMLETGSTQIDIDKIMKSLMVSTGEDGKAQKNDFTMKNIMHILPEQFNRIVDQANVHTHAFKERMQIALQNIDSAHGDDGYAIGDGSSLDTIMSQFNHSLDDIKEAGTVSALETLESIVEANNDLSLILSANQDTNTNDISNAIKNFRLHAKKISESTDGNDFLLQIANKLNENLKHFQNNKIDHDVFIDYITKPITSLPWQEVNEAQNNAIRELLEANLGERQFSTLEKDLFAAGKEFSDLLESDFNFKADNKQKATIGAATAKKLQKAWDSLSNDTQEVVETIEAKVEAVEEIAEAVTKTRVSLGDSVQVGNLDVVGDTSLLNDGVQRGRLSAPSHDYAGYSNEKELNMMKENAVAAAEDIFNAGEVLVTALDSIPERVAAQTLANMGGKVIAALKPDKNWDYNDFGANEAVSGLSFRDELDNIINAGGAIGYIGSPAQQRPSQNENNIRIQEEELAKLSQNANVHRVATANEGRSLERMEQEQRNWEQKQVDDQIAQQLAHEALYEVRDLIPPVDEGPQGTPSEPIHVHVENADDINSDETDLDIDTSSEFIPQDPGHSPNDNLISSDDIEIRMTNDGGSEILMGGVRYDATTGLDLDFEDEKRRQAKSQKTTFEQVSQSGDHDTSVEMGAEVNFKDSIEGQENLAKLMIQKWAQAKIKSTQVTEEMNEYMKALGVEFGNLAEQSSAIQSKVHNYSQKVLLAKQSVVDAQETLNSLSQNWAKNNMDETVQFLNDLQSNKEAFALDQDSETSQISKATHQGALKGAHEGLKQLYTEIFKGQKEIAKLTEQIFKAESRNDLLTVERLQNQVQQLEELNASRMQTGYEAAGMIDRSISDNNLQFDTELVSDMMHFKDFFETQMANIDFSGLAIEKLDTELSKEFGKSIIQAEKLKNTILEKQAIIHELSNKQGELSKAEQKTLDKTQLEVAEAQSLVSIEEKRMEVLNNLLTKMDEQGSLAEATKIITEGIAKADEQRQQSINQVNANKKLGLDALKAQKQVNDDILKVQKSIQTEVTKHTKKLDESRAIVSELSQVEGQLGKDQQTRLDKAQIQVKYHEQMLEIENYRQQTVNALNEANSKQNDISIQLKETSETIHELEKSKNELISQRNAERQLELDSLKAKGEISKAISAAEEKNNKVLTQSQATLSELREEQAARLKYAETMSLKDAEELAKLNIRIAETQRLVDIEESRKVAISELVTKLEQEEDVSKRIMLMREGIEAIDQNRAQEISNVNVEKEESARWLKEHKQTMENITSIRKKMISGSQAENELHQIALNRAEAKLQTLNDQYSANRNIQNAVGDIINLRQQEMDLVLQTSQVSFDNQKKNQNKMIRGFADLKGALDLANKAYQKMLGSVQTVDGHLASIGAVAGLTADEMRNLGSAAFQASNDLNISVNSYLVAMDKWVRAGVGADEAMAASGATAAASVAMQFQNMEQLQAYMHIAERAWGQELSNMALSGAEATEYMMNNIINGMTTINNGFPVTAQVMGAAMQRSAMSLQNLNVGFDEFLGLVTAAQSATQAGGERIGTALQAMSVRIGRMASENTTEMANRLEDLSNKGVTILDPNTGGLRSMMEIMEDLIVAQSRLSETEWLTALDHLGGGQHAQILNGIIDQWDDVGNAMEAVQEQMGMGFDGIAYDMVEAQADTIAARMENIRNIFREFWYEMADGGRAIKDVLDIFINFLNTLRNIFQSENPVVQFIAQSIAGFAQLAMVFGTLATAGAMWSKVATTIHKISGWNIIGIGKEAKARAASVATVNTHTASLNANTAAIVKNKAAMAGKTVTLGTKTIAVNAAALANKKLALSQAAASGGIAGTIKPATGLIGALGGLGKAGGIAGTAMGVLGKVIPPIGIALGVGFGVRQLTRFLNEGSDGADIFSKTMRRVTDNFVSDSTRMDRATGDLRRSIDNLSDSRIEIKGLNKARKEIDNLEGILAETDLGSLNDHELWDLRDKIQALADYHEIDFEVRVGNMAELERVIDLAREANNEALLSRLNEDASGIVDATQYHRNAVDAAQTNAETNTRELLHSDGRHNVDTNDNPAWWQQVIGNAVQPILGMFGTTAQDNAWIVNQEDRVEQTAQRDEGRQQIRVLQEALAAQGMGQTHLFTDDFGNTHETFSATTNDPRQQLGAVQSQMSNFGGQIDALDTSINLGQDKDGSMLAERNRLQEELNLLKQVEVGLLENASELNSAISQKTDALAQALQPYTNLLRDNVMTLGQMNDAFDDGGDAARAMVGVMSNSHNEAAILYRELRDVTEEFRNGEATADSLVSAIIASADEAPPLLYNLRQLSPSIDEAIAHTDDWIEIQKILGDMFYEGSEILAEYPELQELILQATYEELAIREALLEENYMSLDLMIEAMNLQYEGLELDEVMLENKFEKLGLEEEQIQMMLEQGEFLMWQNELGELILELETHKLGVYDDQLIAMTSQGEAQQALLELVNETNGELEATKIITMEIDGEVQNVAVSYNEAGQQVFHIVDAMGVVIEATNAAQQAALNLGRQYAEAARAAAEIGTGVFEPRDIGGGGFGGGGRSGLGPTPRPAPSNNRPSNNRPSGGNDRAPRSPSGGGGDRGGREEAVNDSEVDEAVWRFWRLENQIRRVNDEMNRLNNEMSLLNNEQTRINNQITRANLYDDHAQVIVLLKQQQALTRQQIALEERQQANLRQELDLQTQLRNAHRDHLNERVRDLEAHGFRFDANGALLNYEHARSFVGETAEEVNRMLNDWRSTYNTVRDLNNTMDDLSTSIDDSRTAVDGLELSIREMQEAIRQAAIAKELQALEDAFRRVELAIQRVNNVLSLQNTAINLLSSNDFELGQALHHLSTSQAQESIRDLAEEFNYLISNQSEHDEVSEEVLARLEELKGSMLENADAVIAYGIAINDLQLERTAADMESFTAAIDRNLNRMNALFSNIREGLLSGQDIGDLFADQVVGIEFNRGWNQFLPQFEQRIGMEEALQNSLDLFAQREIDRTRDVANEQLRIQAEKFNRIIAMHEGNSNSITSITGGNFNPGDWQLPGLNDYDIPEHLQGYFDVFNKYYAELRRQRDQDLIEAGDNMQKRNAILEDFAIASMGAQQKLLQQAIAGNMTMIDHFQDRLDRAAELGLTGDQMEEYRQRIRDLQDANHDFQQQIRDTVTAIWDLTFERMERVRREFDILTETANHFMNVLNALNVQDPERMLHVLQMMQRAELARNENLREQRDDLLAQREQVDYMSYEWRRINDQIEEMNSQLRDSDLTLLENNRAILEANIRRIFQNIEREMFGRSLAAHERFRRDWIEGVERELELEEMARRIIDLERDLHEDEMARLRAEFRLIEQQDQLSRVQAAHMRHQISVLEAQRRLEEARDQRTQRRLIETEDGFEWQWEADEDQLRAAEEALRQAERELEQHRQQAEVDFATQLQELLERAQAGDPDLADDEALRAAIEDLRSQFEHVLDDDFMNIEDIDELLDAMEDFFRDRDRMLEEIARQELTPQNIGDEVGRAFRDSAKYLGEVIADAITGTLPDTMSYNTPTHDARIAGRSLTTNSGDAVTHVHNITANFPNANDVTSIQQAIQSLPDLAKQRAGSYRT